MKQLSLKFDFPGSDGNVLSGRLELPAGEPVCFAVFAHCFACSKDAVAAVRISRELAGRGIAVLRFDFTGLGNSQGDFSNTNFSSNVADLVAASRALADQWQAPRFMIGHSLGGLAVLAAASRLDNIDAVITVGAPANVDQIIEIFDVDPKRIEKGGREAVTLDGRTFTIKQDFLQDIRQFDTEAVIKKLKAALLILHAPNDEIVGFDSAESLYNAAKQPKAILPLSDADHMLSNPYDAAYAAAMVYDWVSYHLKISRPNVVEQKDVGHHGGALVTVTETGEGPFTSICHAGQHQIQVDEPASVGGNDTGMSPYELLLGALGACTNMTLRMYAQHKKWPVTRIATELFHQKIEPEDCPDCLLAEGQRKPDKITRRIWIEGKLDETQRARLIDIANKCPVHRTLKSVPLIVTQAADVNDKAEKTEE